MPVLPGFLGVTVPAVLAACQGCAFAQTERAFDRSNDPRTVAMRIMKADGECPARDGNGNALVHPEVATAAEANHFGKRICTLHDSCLAAATLL